MTKGGRAHVVQARLAPVLRAVSCLGLPRRAAPWRALAVLAVSLACAEVLVEGDADGTLAEAAAAAVTPMEMHAML